MEQVFAAITAEAATPSAAPGAAAPAPAMAESEVAPTAQKSQDYPLNKATIPDPLKAKTWLSDVKTNITSALNAAEGLDSNTNASAAAAVAGYLRKCVSKGEGLKVPQRPVLRPKHAERGDLMWKELIVPLAGAPAEGPGPQKLGWGEVHRDVTQPKFAEPEHYPYTLYATHPQGRIEVATELAEGVEDRAAPPEASVIEALAGVSAAQGPLPGLAFDSPGARKGLLTATPLAES